MWRLVSKGKEAKDLCGLGSDVLATPSQTGKSFLLLFFKKEGLTIFPTMPGVKDAW
jgi:hypothetical protein